MSKLIFEIGGKGRRAFRFPKCDVPEMSLGSILGEDNLRACAPTLPECGEVDVVRHFTNLSQLNFALDTGFYPLGSCTMKYNPKINENLSRLSGFAEMHPLQDEEDSQGALEMYYGLERALSSVLGMSRFSLQPAAGAHGELTGLMIIAAYHRSRGDDKRKVIIVPDSSHGTNPASAAIAGFTIKTIKSGPDGLLDLDALAAALGEDTAGMMLTNPSTLGLFEKDIVKAAEMVHAAGGLLYYDGANSNAILCKTTPSMMGFDVVHLNLHKTFGTPHGGGGPGSGPVGVVEKLVPFLPYPLVGCKDGKYYWEERNPLSIGKVRSYYGNFGVLIKAYAYILALGAEGLDEVSTTAVANANYLLKRLTPAFDLPYGDGKCMHEFVLSGQKQKDESGVSTLDMAKRLIEMGYHPPTVYFPLIVHEAMMIEPTETEAPETLSEFADALLQIAEEAKQCPDKLHAAPQNKPVTRLDETTAARNPILKYNG